MKKYVKKVKDPNISLEKYKARQKRKNEKAKLNRLKQPFSGTGMRKQGLYKEANQSAKNIPKSTTNKNKSTIPVLEESSEENQVSHSVLEEVSNNNMCSDTADCLQKKTQNLKKKGFQNVDYSKYFVKDKKSNNCNTNKHRFYRIHFLLQQLARDSGAELLLFSYSPNEDVGSCGAWQFGGKTSEIVEKPWVKSFLKQWENTCTQLEVVRNQVPEILDYIDDQFLGEHAEVDNQNVLGANKIEENSEKEHVGDNLGTNLNTETYILTQASDGTYHPPKDLTAALDVWGLNSSNISVLTEVEVATTSEFDFPSPVNPSPIVAQVPVNNQRKRKSEKENGLPAKSSVAPALSQILNNTADQPSTAVTPQAVPSLPAKSPALSETPRASASALDFIRVPLVNIPEHAATESMIEEKKDAGGDPLDNDQGENQLIADLENELSADAEKSGRNQGKSSSTEGNVKQVRDKREPRKTVKNKNQNFAKESNPSPKKSASKTLKVKPNEKDKCPPKLCKKPRGKQLTVQCKEAACNQWFHMRCLGLKPNSLKDEELYICSDCQQYRRS